MMPRKHALSAACSLIAATFLLMSTAEAADNVRPAKISPSLREYTDQIIIRLKDEPVSQKRAAMSAGRARALSLSANTPLQPVRPAGASAQVVKLPQPLPIAEVQAIAAKLAQDSTVLYAEADRRKYPHRVATDPRNSEQWYLFESAGGINAESAWDVTTGSSSIVVAVLDGGVVFANSDLQARLLPGFDFVSPDPANNCLVAGCPFATANDGSGRDTDPSDPGDWIPSNEQGVAPFQSCPPDPDPTLYDSSWHGTHVAGIIGANANNGVGVTGLDWAARILPVRVLGKCGGYTSDIIDGMRWAAGLRVSGVPDNPAPAQVLNLSLGAVGSCSASEQNAIDEILTNTSVRAIVTSAGNEGIDASLNAPGNCSGVINVAATDRSGSRPSYSNFGSAVTLSAPGGVITGNVGTNAILSLSNSGITVPTTDSYAFFAGTSSATPQVSGAISLMLGVNPALTAADVRNILTVTARQFASGSNCITACGAGILDVGAAVRRALAMANNTNTTSSGGGGGGGGGGCTTGAGANDIVLPALVLLSLLSLAYRKR